MINILIDKHHSKKALPHCMATSHLMSKQWLRVKSPMIDTKNCLNEVLLTFDSWNKELSPSFCLVDTFSDLFSFLLVG